MNSTFKGVLIGVAIIGLLVGVGFAVSIWKDRQLVRETIERVTLKNKLLERAEVEKAARVTSDSIVRVIVQKDALIKKLEGSQTIVIYKNDQIHLDIDRLNAINTALLWTNNIAEYEHNRDRYNLHRFIDTAAVK